MLFSFYIFRKKCLCHCKNNGLIQNTIRRSVCAFFVFCFINIGFRIYALQYPMHLWLWIDVRFDGLAVVFLLWSWALALDVIHVKPRRLRTRCVTVDWQNNDVTNFFIQFIFVYNFGCLAMCVAHALCGPAIVFSARKFMFFFYCAHICLPCCLFDNFCLGIDVQTTSHTAYATHTYTLVDAMCECVWFFYVFSGICCDWIRTTRANHIICLNISENFVTLSCGRPFIWCENRLGSVSMCVCVGRESPALSIIM